MRILLVAATLAGAAALPASAGQAQPWGYGRYNPEVRQELRECRRELRRADSRREYRRELRECRRELRRAEREYRRDLRNNYGYYDRGYHGYNDRRYYDSRRYWDGYRWRYR
jgi:hypothetical protein